MQVFLVPTMLGDVNLVELVKLYKLATGCPEDGAVFIHWNKHWLPSTSLGKSSCAEVPRAVATFLGLDHPKSYTGHGLRATGATLMCESGATLLQIQHAGNWKNPETVWEGVPPQERCPDRAKRGVHCRSPTTTTTTPQNYICLPSCHLLQLHFQPF